METPAPFPPGEALARAAALPEPSEEERGAAAVPAECDWESLYDTMRPVLVRTACARFRVSVDDAEDLVQDIFEEVLRRAPLVRFPEKYLRTALYNACFERFRNSRRRATVALEEETSVDARSVERLQDQCAARGAFQRIDPECRRLVSRYCIEEFTLKETATEAGVTVNAVWKRIQQCLRSMNLFFERAQRSTRRRLSSSSTRSAGT